MSDSTMKQYLGNKDQHMKLHHCSDITLLNVQHILSCSLYVYRPRSEGDNVLGSVRPSVRPSAEHTSVWVTCRLSPYVCL